MRNAKSEVVRHGLFLFFVLAAAALMYGPLSGLFGSSLKRDYHTLIPVIPFISLYLIYSERKDIFKAKDYCLIAGLPVILTGIVLYAAGWTFGGNLNRNDLASVMCFSAWLMLLGGFICSYGLRAFRVALFPLLFLVLMVPVPESIMEGIITFLQVGSTEVTNLLLLASGAPFVREGFVFHLPGQSVEVAKECSGIRSGLALFITALLAGHLFLRTWWKKVILVLCFLPITMLKNGIRITTLTLLGTYVDPRILQSSLHREGGIPFFIVALLLLAPVLYFLRRSDRKRATSCFPDIPDRRRKGEMRLVSFGMIVAVMLALSGFGCSDKPLSSGTYVLSQVSFSQDECNIGDNITDGDEIDVTVNESKVNVYMAKDLTPPTGAILGDSFMAVASKDSDVIPETDCRDMWIKKVTGKLVRKSVFTGVYEFTDKTLSGNDCADEEKIGFHPPLCTSTVTFTATKK